jgi:hypothetical protein
MITCRPLMAVKTYDRAPVAAGAIVVEDQHRSASDHLLGLALLQRA